MIYMSPMQSRQMTAAFVNTFPNPPQRMPSASMTRNTVMKKHAGLIRRNSEPITCLYGVGLTGIVWTCLLYTSDAADDLRCVDLGGRRIIKKKRQQLQRNHIRTE